LEFFTVSYISLSNMSETNVVFKGDELKENISTFFKQSMALRKKTGNCMVKDEMAMLLDKWSLFVIYNLGYYQKLRFKDLKENIRGISSKMLSQTLKKIERQKIIRRHVFAEVPPRVEYELTDYGMRLTKKVLELNQWFLDNH